MTASITRRRLAQDLVLAAGGVLVLTAPLRASASAEQFILDLANQVLEIITGSATQAGKKERFRRLLVSRADIPAIAIFSLGRYARRLSERDRIDYYGLVADYISGLFATHAIGLGGERVTVTGSTARSERETIVKSKVRFASGRSLDVNWRVIHAEDSFKVFDVSINGIWLAIQQRTEFMSVIKRGGGTVDALLDYLRRRSDAS